MSFSKKLSFKWGKISEKITTSQKDFWLYIIICITPQESFNKARFFSFI